MARKLYDLAGADPERRFSPTCWRVRMALAHKGLEVETVPWRFTDKDAIAFADTDRVPVLVDGERVVADSWDIACYLEETYPDAPPLFGNEAARGEALVIKHWLEQSIHPLVARLILLDVYHQLHEKDRQYFRHSREDRLGMSLEQFCSQSESALRALRQTLSPVRETLRQQDFLCGTRPGFADYMLLGPFQWARCTSPVRLLREEDPVHPWRERMLGLFDGLAGNAPGYPV
jgi:glutathione S-transferase